MKCKNCGALIADFSLEIDTPAEWSHLEGMQSRRCPDGSGNNAEPEDHDLYPENPGKADEEE